jgi:hypothetical protein
MDHACKAKEENQPADHYGSVVLVDRDHSGVETVTKEEKRR